MKRIYLDWNATAPTHPAVIEAMVKTLQSDHGNPSSVHYDGQQARSIVEVARRHLAKLIGAQAQGIVFYSGATEANNTVLQSLVCDTENPYLVSSPLEHPSVYYVCQHLQELGHPVHMLKVNIDGELQRDDLDHHLDLGCNLVSLMLANNEIGNINPIREICEQVRAKNENAIIHVDATQALGRIPLNFQELSADIMTLAFHKTGGPKGLGAAVFREGLLISPILHGGQQERGRRPGTENVVAAAGLSALCKVVDKELEKWMKHLLELKQRLLNRLCSEPTILHVGSKKEALPNTVNLRFQGIESEDLLLAADLEGLSLSAGSACSSGSIEPSHVLLALGLSKKEAKESVRISFGCSTTLQEIDQACDILLKNYQRITSIKS